VGVFLAFVVRTDLYDYEATDAALGALVFFPDYELTREEAALEGVALGAFGVTAFFVGVAVGVVFLVV